ncbi:MAG: c-type cytochrome [Sulfuricaulis sp.]
MKRIGSVVAMALLLIGGCGKNVPPAPSATDSVPAPQANQSFSAASLSRGARLYQENCAECHGPEAQGHPDWRNPQVVAAPPLDGSGNAWKRKKQDLIAVIKNGVSRQGEPAMPTWQGRLNDQDIEDIIAWFQSLWPADIYARWRQDNAAGAAPKG